MKTGNINNSNMYKVFVKMVDHFYDSRRTFALNLELEIFRKAYFVAEDGGRAIGQRTLEAVSLEAVSLEAVSSSAIVMRKRRTTRRASRRHLTTLEHR